ncbi:MAG: hypothetical protein R3E48_05735 [Burkholderiaceae bacterium]
MTYYADLDVAVIDALPPGRKPVATRLVSDRRRAEAVGRVGDACDQGATGLLALPADRRVGIRRQRGRGRASAPQTVASAMLPSCRTRSTPTPLAEQLAPRSIGLVHLLARAGREAKRSWMPSVAGEIQVLVATTVIEVGVDVANASLMVIEHAERFGLAQLHQFAGESVSVQPKVLAVSCSYRELLSATGQGTTQGNVRNHDGAEIARRDLMLRGPGEFLGARQSGVPMLRYADLERDVDLVERACDLAAELSSIHLAAPISCCNAGSAVRRISCA